MPIMLIPFLAIVPPAPAFAGLLAIDFQDEQTKIVGIEIIRIDYQYLVPAT